MAQFVEFVGNHYILSSIWLALVGAFFFIQQKSGTEAVSTQKAIMLINHDDGAVLDIRDKKEFEAGHIVDAINIPLASLATRITELEKRKLKPVIVVCKMGQQSGEACKLLKKEEFPEIVRLSGGISEWKAQNLPLVQK